MSNIGTKVRAGDMIAVQRTEHDYYIGQPNTERTRVDVARVTRATREGLAVEWEDVCGYKMGAGGRVVVIPAAKIDPADVLRVAREHHYDGHPNQPRPFDSLEELRDALRPFLKSVQS